MTDSQPEPVNRQKGTIGPTHQAEHGIGGIFKIVEKSGETIAPWYYLTWLINLAVVSIGIPIYQKKPWRSIPAYFFLAVVGATLLTVLTLLLKRVFPHGRRSGETFGAVHEQLIEDYQRGDLSLLIMVQFVLRAILVIFVLLSTIPIAFLSQASPAASNVGRTILITFAFYFLLCVFYFFRGRAKNQQALSDSTARISGILWPPAVMDCCVITVLSIAMPGDNWHLAYIIPCLAAWLFTESGRGKLLFEMILIGILLKYLVLCLIRVWFSAEAVQFGIESKPVLALLLNGLTPKLLFWSAVTFPFALLKKLRTLETKKSQILSAVTENIMYAVFRKDKNRRFEFANGAFLRGLGKTWVEIKGKTDLELRIERDAYRKSDEAVLNATSPAFGVWQGLEPNYEKSDRAHEMIWTTKKAISDPSGQIVGLVGVCEPGGPMQVAVMFERILGEAPYYVVLKDTTGHIKWANPGFCKRDVGKSLEELLAMNNGRGATDVDLYGEELGAQYQIGDGKVMTHAQHELDLNRDPLASPFVNDELHYFPLTKRYRWVRTTKTAWLDMETLTIKGVQVYFHDFHEFACLDGMMGRWVSSHLPYSLSHLTDISAQGSTSKVPAELRLVVLKLQIVNWIKRLSADKHLLVEDQPFEIGDLRWMQKAIGDVYKKVHFDFNWPKNDHLQVFHDINIIEATVLILAMNAYESSIVKELWLGSPLNPDGSPRREDPTVEIQIFANTKNITIEVKDHGHGFSRDEQADINDGKKLHKDGKPGSGLFLVRYFANEICKGAFTIESAGLEKGATARFIFPVHRLTSRTKVESDFAI